MKFPGYIVDGRAFQTVAGLSRYLMRKHSAVEMSMLRRDGTIGLFKPRGTEIATYEISAPVIGKAQTLVLKNPRARVRENTGVTWTHKVVKQQRGANGEWFSYPGRGYSSEFEAVAAAEKFAARQSEVPGTRIVVLARKRGRVITVKKNPRGVTVYRSRPGKRKRKRKAKLNPARSHAARVAAMRADQEKGIRYYGFKAQTDWQGDAATSVEAKRLYREASQHFAAGNYSEGVRAWKAADKVKKARKNPAAKKPLPLKVGQTIKLERLGQVVVYNLESAHTMVVRKGRKYFRVSGGPFFARPS